MTQRRSAGRLKDVWRLGLCSKKHTARCPWSWGARGTAIKNGARASMAAAARLRAAEAVVSLAAGGAAAGAGVEGAVVVPVGVGAGGAAAVPISNSAST